MIDCPPCEHETAWLFSNQLAGYNYSLLCKKKSFPFGSMMGRQLQSLMTRIFSLCPLRLLTYM